MYYNWAILDFSTIKTTIEINKPLTQETISIASCTITIYGTRTVIRTLLEGGPGQAWEPVQQPEQPAGGSSHQGTATCLCAWLAPKQQSSGRCAEADSKAWVGKVAVEGGLRVEEPACTPGGNASASWSPFKIWFLLCGNLEIVLLPLLDQIDNQKQNKSFGSQSHMRGAPPRPSAGASGNTDLSVLCQSL